jgi:Mrp family chromosome partitioning ATPase
VTKRPGPPSNKPTLPGFGSVRPPGDHGQRAAGEHDAGRSPSGPPYPEVPQGAASDPQAMTRAEVLPRSFLADGQLPSLRQTLPLGSPLHSGPTDGGSPADRPSATLLVDPGCRRLTSDEWQAVSPDQGWDSRGGLADAGPLAPQTTVRVLAQSHAPLPVERWDERDSTPRSSLSHPPLIVSPVIRVSNSVPDPIVTTEGVFVPDRMGSAAAPTFPVTRAGYGNPSSVQAGPSIPVSSSMVLVPTSTRPGAMAREEPRPAVMRALLAAVDVLQTGRVTDALQPIEASSPSSVVGRPVVVAMAEPPAVDHRTRLTIVDLPDSGRAEAFRVLRHRLRTAGDPRIVAVASPYAGDEAAICAAELALAYAHASSEQVLLLESDTHHPRLARLFGINVEYCFAMQMYEKYDGSPEPWRATSVFRSNLHVFAVSPALMAGERLVPPVFQQAISDLARGSYGRIIVVCPKVLDSAGVSLIEGHVDGVLLTGPAGRTHANDLRRAAKQLAPTTVLGVTLLEPG